MHRFFVIADVMQIPTLLPNGRVNRIALGKPPQCCSPSLAILQGR